MIRPSYDVVVVGGGPAGATAADTLAKRGHRVALLDKAGRIKPCGGAIPPRLIRDYAIPDSLIVARAKSARMVSPSDRTVDMPIENGYVGMVDREEFDEWLRERANHNGATRVTGRFVNIEFDTDDHCLVHYQADSERCTLRARFVIGADGANSKVARQTVPGGDSIPYVAAYHEIVESTPNAEASFNPQRCDVYYQGKVSPDFYGWVFPHGNVTSIGVGSAVKGFSLRNAVGGLREEAGLADAKTVRREGAPIPLKPLKRWDNGRNVILAGDAAGVVAPASGEGIYYAMLGGQLAAEAASECLETGNVKALSTARRRFMRDHGRVFLVLRIMQRFWYCSDKRRERFVSICKDPDVQKLTWDSYMNKALVRKKPMAHVRIFFKDLAHLFGLVAAR